MYKLIAQRMQRIYPIRAAAVHVMEADISVFRNINSTCKYDRKHVS